MENELSDAKRRVKGQFLGKHGVHGVGVREADNAVAVYVDAAAKPSEELMSALKKAAGPFGVVVVNQERAVARPAGEA
jgi:hypothetical protein